MKTYILLITTLFINSIAQAELITTITQTTDVKGAENTIVEYKKIPTHTDISNFAQADKNNDGCIDQQEAHDASIFHIEKFAKTRKNCLLPEEFEKALTTKDNAAQ